MKLMAKDKIATPNHIPDVRQIVFMLINSIYKKAVPNIFM
jgi:hypothetical protein